MALRGSYLVAFEILECVMSLVFLICSRATHVECVGRKRGVSARQFRARGAKLLPKLSRAYGGFRDRDVTRTPRRRHDDLASLASDILAAEMILNFNSGFFGSLCTWIIYFDLAKLIFCTHNDRF